VAALKNEIHGIALPQFKYYEPKNYHPNWDEIREESHALAKKIAANMMPFTFRLKITSRKRRFFAIIKLLKNLFINKHRAAKGYGTAS